MRRRSSPQGGDAADVSTTVVIPAYRATDTLPLVLDALGRQGSAVQDVILVDSTGDDVAKRMHTWPAVHVIAPDRRTLPGPARNIGASKASGEWLAFLDADAIPDPGWLAELLAAAGPSVDAIAGSVRNGTPESVIGTASWLLEFSEFMPGRRRSPRHGASCNLLVRRSALDAIGGFPANVWPGEDTIVTFPLAQRGRLAFAGQATVAHLNRTGFAEFWRHQRRLGVSFGIVCEQTEFPHRWIARRPFSIGAGCLRVQALVIRILDVPTEIPSAVMASPLIIVGLVAWTLGLVTGR